MTEGALSLVKEIQGDSIGVDRGLLSYKIVLLAVAAKDTQFRPGEIPYAGVRHLSALKNCVI